MASFKQYTASGGASEAFSIPSFTSDEIKVRVDGVLKTAGTHYNITSYTANGGTVTWTSGNVPSSGTVYIYRDTKILNSGNSDVEGKATYSNSSPIYHGDLNDNQKQVLRAIEEENDQLIQSWDLASASVETSSIKDGTIVDADINASANIAGSKLADDSVTLAKLGGGALPTDITVASANIVNGTIVDADVNASAAIAGTKISPNFGSQNIVTSGTVDGRDVSADGIKLDSIETGATADQNASEIRALVESASDSNVFTDADHTKLNAIESNATADQTAAEIRTLVESASDSNVFTDADHTKLNAIEANATADQTITEIKSLIAGSPLGPTHLAESYYTEAESDARYFNISTGDTIKDGDAFPDNDTTIATTAAINDRIIDLVDDVGGFVPIANETSFPNANPDVNNGTGTLISIKALSSNITSNGSGVATIANGTVGNSTVTITGLENSTTYSSGYGMIVETTTTLNTYTFHRLVPKATEVTTVAGKATEIGRLGTAAAVEDLGILGTTDVVADLAILGTNDVVADLAILGSTDVVADMNTLAVTSVINNMDTCATNVSNINNVGGSISNVNTVATNISNVNDFSDKYRVASSAPTSNNDAGDLYFDTSSNELRVYNGSSWQGGVTATGNLAGLGANTFTGNQSLGDNKKVILGTGSDLQIYHDGSHSRIKDDGTGYLIINTDTGVLIKNGADDEGIAYFTPNGAVELMYDNSKKLETTSGGVTVTGDLKLPDNGILRLGDATYGDLKVYHTGSANIIDNAEGHPLHIRYTANEEIAKFIPNGAVELYYDNSKKLETTSDGVTVTGKLFADNGFWCKDNDVYRCGDGTDLMIYHNGSHSFLKHTTTGYLRLLAAGNGVSIQNDDESEAMAYFLKDGAVELYYDGSKKIQTNSHGVDILDDLVFDNGTNSGKDINWVESSNTMRWQDDVKAAFGAGDDLQIYHNGSHNYINSTTDSQNLYISAVNGNISLQPVKDADHGVLAKANNAVELYYDGSKKFETNASGVKVFDYLRFTDSGKAMFGAGDDLQIYHNGSHAYIDNGTGDTYIRPDGLFYIIDKTSNDVRLLARDDGAVELYYDGTKKLETDPNGVKFNDDTYVLDGNSSYWGTGNDLQIVHDGGNSFIKEAGTGSLFIYADGTYLKNAAGDENLAAFVSNGAVQLYYDNSKKFETFSGGVKINGGLQLLDDGTNNIWRGGTQTNWIQSDGNTYITKNLGTEYSAKFNTDGAVELYYDNSKKFETQSTGAQVTGSFIALDAGANGIHSRSTTTQATDTNKAFKIRNNSDTDTFSISYKGNVYLPDSNKINLGTGNDLQIYHDGTNNYIYSDNKTLYLNANGSTISINPVNAENSAKFLANGAVELYHDGSKKFDTTSTGVTVTGTVSDSKGDLRTIPQLSKSSKHTIVLADAGKHSINSSGGWELDTSTAFTAGMAITLINNSGSDQTIEADGVTLYNTADAATGNRTLAGRGMATVICTASNTYYISGAGLS